MSTAEQIKALNENRIHLGIICENIHSIDSNIYSAVLAHRVPFYIAIPKEHPLSSSKSPVKLKHFKDQPFIMSVRRNEPKYYDTILSIFQQSGFRPNIYQESDNIFTILNLVTAGWGCAVVTELCLEYPGDGIVLKKIDNQTTIDISIIWRKDEKSSLVNTFSSVLNEMLDEPITN